jgi:hypothetical protein
MTDNSRIAEIEAKIAAAQAELAALKAGKSAPPPPPPRDEVRIIEILSERGDGPNLKEMERLYAKVKPLSPWPSALTDKYDEHRPFRGFSSAFRWVMNMGRLDRPNGKVALGYFLDGCRDWLRARNSVGSDLDANGLILAVYAAGDVVYTPANSMLGHTWEIGLVEYGGRKASDAWRNVMTSGQILPPSAPSRRFAPPSPARVFVGY